MRLSFFERIDFPVYLAFSGGIDSMVLLHLLILRKIDVKLLFTHHQAEFCNEELKFSQAVSSKYGIELIVKSIKAFDGIGSKEAYWSRQRHNIYQQMDRVVLTGHHLDDAVEWYVMSTFQGTPKLLDYKGANICRPFICVPKTKIQEYANRRNIDYLTDPSNLVASSGLRNQVRLTLLPKAHECFPGLRKTVSRLIVEKWKKSNQRNS